MCRFIAFYFERERVDALSKIIDALVEASSNDPYLGKLASDTRHCHGFGYVLALNVHGSWRIMFEKGDYDDCERNLRALKNAAEKVKRAIKEGEKGFLIIHARRTSREPRGPLNAHPFTYVRLLDQGKMIFFFAQNGGVRKEDISNNLNVPPELFTDTFLALAYIATKVKKPNDVIEMLKSAMKFTYSKSAFNTALLCVMNIKRKDILRLYITAYYGDDVRRSQIRMNYYQAYLVREDGLIGYIPSTVKDILHFSNIGLKIEKMNDRIIEISEDGIIINDIKI